MALYLSEQDHLRVEEWLDRVVIGENLCPFASLPRRQGRVEICFSDARDDDTLLDDFLAVLNRLMAVASREIETTLLVAPHIYPDFLDYNDSLVMLEMAMGLSGAAGQLQLASFHPGYCFEGQPPEDPANFTNRAPFPIYHLLREDSVTQALRGVADPEAIPERNIRHLRAMSVQRRRALFPGLDD